MRIRALLLVGAACTLAVCSAADAGSAGITEGQVRSWLKQWQWRLSLEDWAITTHMVRAGDLKRNTVGHVKWDREAHVASIEILRPEDYPRDVVGVADDIEYTIVHELVHIQLGRLPRDVDRKREEDVVNRLADALISLARSSRALTAGR